MTMVRLAPYCFLLILAGLPALGQEPTKPKAEADAKPATTKVRKGPVRVALSLKGVVESGQMAEISLRPEASTLPLTVEKAVEHGTAVKKGDVLVELDPEKIDQAIKDLEVERALADLALKQAERELPILEKFAPLDLAAAERAKARADEDLARFLQIDRPLEELSAQFQMKSSEFSLEYARDELSQLEKMYRSKDLTEETERLILKRHQFQVEMAEFQVKSAETTRDRTFKVTLPRQEQAERDAADRQALALQKVKDTQELEVGQKRLALAKLRHDGKRGEEKLAKLREDRKLYTVLAPADGVVFYGRSTFGQWAAASTVAPKLQKGGVLTPGEVFLTVVAPRPAFVRAAVEEKDLHDLRPKLRGKAVPAGYPGRGVPARVASVSPVPVSPGNFEARVDLDLGEGDDAVMPGMACTVKLVAYEKDQALTVPTSAVFADDADDSQYVYATREGGKPEKKAVKVGRAAGDRTEILDGLREGDELLTSKP